MIFKCRICGGKGFIQSGNLFNFVPDRKLCPSCKGAGEFDLKISQENLTTCKYCGGRGIIIFQDFVISGATEKICPSCNGIGFLERPQIGIKNNIQTRPETTQNSRLFNIEYDLAISFAGEDRSVVNSYAEAIKSKGFKIFYADFDESDLWGTNLYETLDTIYRLKAHFCVIFISRYYATKIWTTHERRSAQARALMENKEYILPVRLDDTEIPGLISTIGYLDFDKVGHAGLVKTTIEKLSKFKSGKRG